MKRYGLLICLLFSFFINAQELSKEDILFFNKHQDSISLLIRNSVKIKSDEERLELNYYIQNHFNKVMNHPLSHLFPFDSLQKFKLLLISPDKEVRIITWDLPLNDRTHKYFGYLQYKSKVSGKWMLKELTDKSDEIKKPETSKLNADNWYGCYYFKIIQTKHKRKKSYVLLGWDGNSFLTQKKLIDVLNFDKQGEPYFGSSIFEVYVKSGKRLIKVMQKRVFFEYKQGIVMSIVYDEKKGAIVFDHLSPEDSSQEGQYQFYGPDMSLDAYRFKKGKWLLLSDADGRNNKSKTDKKYSTPEDDPFAPKK